MVGRSDRAMFYFAQLISDLRSLGVYAVEDSAAHNSWAHAMDEMERAEIVLLAEGMVTTCRNGTHVNPWCKVRDSARNEAARLSKDFGLTPSARVGLSSSKKKTADQSIENIFKRKTA